MRGQLFPRVRIFEVRSAVDGPNGCDDYRGYAIAVRWLGWSVEFTISRRAKS